MRSLRSGRLPVLLSLVVCVWAGPSAAAQDLALRPAPESRIWVDGTSNKSDWTVEAKALTGSFTIDGETVTGARIEVPAEKMESPRSKIMDRLMYKTLKSGQHPSIAFRLSRAAAMASGADGGRSLAVTGELAIAGVTREVSFPVTAVPVTGGAWKFTGQVSVLLTDFDMVPPTALFGALHTGDEVTIRFDVVAGR